MTLITVVYDDARLLPQFLRHYSALGVSRFLIGVYSQMGLSNNVESLCNNYDHKLFPISHGYSGPKDTDFRHHIAEAFLKPDEWWVVADLDEFHEYPHPLRQLCNRLDHGGYRFFGSHMLDRITSDGSSPDVQPYAPLWEQFPAAAYITERLTQVRFSKIMLMRGHVKTVVGHHKPRDGSRKHVLVGGLVHHFKWHSNIYAKVRARKEVIRRSGFGHHTRLDRFLRFWDEHHRLPVEGEFGFHFPVKPGNWPDPHGLLNPLTRHLPLTSTALGAFRASRRQGKQWSHDLRHLRHA